MKSKLLLFALLLMGVSARAQIVSVSISEDCSENGNITFFVPIGNAVVSSTSGRNSCEWVQLWANGPKWATFNVGATITSYANLTIETDATSYYNFQDQASYYNTANVGGLYAWNQPNRNGRKNIWSSGVTTAVADVATTLWGSNWRTPTHEQLDTLTYSRYGKTIWTWCDGTNTQYVTGCTLKGYKISGVGEFADRSIFLPAAGTYDYVNGEISNASNNGGYWSRTEYGSSDAYVLYISLSRGYTDGCYRRLGRSVRAVLVE